MTMTAALLLDAVILVFLLFFLIQGIRRGFILTLCSLLAVFLALAGGWFLAHQYTEPVQEALEPVILRHLIKERSSDPDALLTEDPSLTQSLQGELSGVADSVYQTLLVQQSKAIASLAAKALLFLGGFLGVLLIWVILCHALDLVARLPGLHFLNKLMGGILGLVKGLLLLMVLRWVLCDLLGWIPDEVAAESYLLPLLSGWTMFSLPGR